MGLRLRNLGAVIVIDLAAAAAGVGCARVMMHGPQASHFGAVVVIDLAAAAAAAANVSNCTTLT
jgi:hypothetical protein